MLGCREFHSSLAGASIAVVMRPVLAGDQPLRCAPNFTVAVGPDRSTQLSRTPRLEVVSWDWTLPGPAGDAKALSDGPQSGGDGTLER